MISERDMLAPMRRSVLLIAPACAIAPVSGAAETIEGRARIIDGDTLEIGGTTIRLNGIDAPEHGQKCEKSVGSREWWKFEGGVISG